MLLLFKNFTPTTALSTVILAQINKFINADGEILLYQLFQEEKLRWT